MGRGKLFGDRPAGMVSLVEAPVTRVYAHKARVAFFASAPLIAVVIGAALSTVLSVALAALLGAVVGVVVGLAVAVIVRIWPVLRALWWWALEIAVLLSTLVGLAALSRATSPLLAVLAAVAVTAAVGLVPPMRRLVVAWWWCAVVRHRLRMCFGQFIRAAGRGQAVSLPLMLLARPTPAGERVWVWLRPGLDLTDLDGRTGKLAVACWAGEARVVRASARYAALVRIDLTRRDPLTRLVASPLPALLGDALPGLVPVSPGMPPLALDLDDVPEPQPEPQQRRR
jgi:hypothetical protein